SGTVNTHDSSGVLGKVYGRAPLWHFQQATPSTAPDDAIHALAAQVVDAADPLAAMHDLSAEILQAVPYQIGETHAHTVAADALAQGAGVCQDHAQIFISAVRAAGLPARYISGYLMMADRVDQDATHAWAEAHVDGLGWVGFDVSNGYSPDERYVRVAVGRDARDAAPTEGLRMGDTVEQMIVSVQVQQ
ncbi:MAG: transglutaminase family protein, partial [Pseudomonadota bacterium]